jgi:soluble lytic murein transglycosylase-like protein
MRIFTILIGVMLMLAAQAARADIYAYIDEKGDAHFAVEKVDERYQLYLKGEQSFDTGDLNGPSTAKPALLRYLSEHPNLKKFEPLVKAAARQYSVDPALIKAVMAAESGFNPGAVSPKGAIGLMQIMPGTARRYGLQADKKNSVEKKLHDPQTNIELAARYLHDLHKMFPGQPQLVLASYNAGEGAVQKYRNTIPPYKETQNYVQLVSQFYRLYKPRTAQTVQTPGFDVTTDAGNKRIYMTLPGRQSMPSGVTQ